MDGLQVERLAKALSISRSGFYWHFNNRADFLKAMQTYWAQQFTYRIIDEVLASAVDARSQLAQLPRLINSYNATRCDPAMWVWAGADSDVKQLVNRVRDARMKFVGSLIKQCGFSGADLKARTRLFVVYFSWAGVMFDGEMTHGRPKAANEIIDIILAPKA